MVAYDSCQQQLHCVSNRTLLHQPGLCQLSVHENFLESQCNLLHPLGFSVPYLVLSKVDFVVVVMFERSVFNIIVMVNSNYTKSQLTKNTTD